MKKTVTPNHIVFRQMDFAWPSWLAKQQRSLKLDAIAIALLAGIYFAVKFFG